MKFKIPKGLKKIFKKTSSLTKKLTKKHTPPKEEEEKPKQRLSHEEKSLLEMLSKEPDKFLYRYQVENYYKVELNKDPAGFDAVESKLAKLGLIDKAMDGWILTEKGIGAAK